MELFLVTDPLPILTELLNFYGILSEKFLISVFSQEDTCEKNPTQFPFLHTKFVVFLHHRCSLPPPPPAPCQKKTTEKD